MKIVVTIMKSRTSSCLSCLTASSLYVSWVLSFVVFLCVFQVDFHLWMSGCLGPKFRRVRDERSTTPGDSSDWLSGLLPPPRWPLCTQDTLPRSVCSLTSCRQPGLLLAELPRLASFQRHFQLHCVQNTCSSPGWPLQRWQRSSCFYWLILELF